MTLSRALQVPAAAKPERTGLLVRTSTSCVAWKYELPINRYYKLKISSNVRHFFLGELHYNKELLYVDFSWMVSCVRFPVNLGYKLVKSNRDKQTNQPTKLPANITNKQANVLLKY